MTSLTKRLIGKGSGQAMEYEEEKSDAVTMALEAGGGLDASQTKTIMWLDLNYLSYSFFF